jgi:hypothetical protein
VEENIRTNDKRVTTSIVFEDIEACGGRRRWWYKLREVERVKWQSDVLKRYHDGSSARTAKEDRDLSQEAGRALHCHDATLRLASPVRSGRCQCIILQFETFVSFNPVQSDARID